MNQQPLRRESTTSTASDTLIDGVSDVGSTITGKFDWIRGEYGEERRVFMGMRESTFRIIALSIGLLASVGVFILYKLTPGYEIFTDYYPINLNWIRESERWVLFISILIGSHALISLITWYIPVFVYLICKREVPERVSLLGSFYVNIQQNLARALFLIVPYVLSSLFFPPPPPAADTEDKPPASMETVFSLLWKQRKLKAPTSSSLAQYPWQTFATQVLLALLIAAWLFVVQRALITYLAMYYHRRTWRTDIEANHQALAVIRILKRKLCPSEKLSHQNTGLRLYERLMSEKGIQGVDAITPHHLSSHLSSAESNALFKAIDLDENGSLTREEFDVGIQHLYLQRGNLQKSIFDENQIIRGLDALLHKIFMVICVVIAFVIIDPSMEDRLMKVGATVMAATVLFHETAAVAVESIIFIVVTHPFDVGDAVIVGDERYNVKECGLWMCTFTAGDGKTVYLTNHKLHQMYIANVKRSPPMDEDIEVKVSGDTTEDQLDRLETELKSFVQAHSRDFEGTRIKAVKILDKDRICITIGLKHRSNFQNGPLKNRRSRDFSYHLRDTLESLDIKIAPPVH